MSLQKKIIVGTAVYLVFLLALFVFVNGFPIHRQEFDRAYIAWLDNPSPQTKSLLHAQSRKTLMIHLENSAAVAFVLWFGGFACYQIVGRLRRPPSSAHRQTGMRITSK